MKRLASSVGTKISAAAPSQTGLLSIMLMGVAITGART